MKEKDNSKDQMIEGYNPRVYRNLSILFIALTILNLIITVYAFAKSGYGLWHAEDALSCIAKIDSSFENINSSILEIELNSGDPEYTRAESASILEFRSEIDSNAEKFRQIDITNVDETLPAEFEMTMSKIDLYYNVISEHLQKVQNAEENIPELRNDDTERLRKEASNAMDKLFKMQDEATYEFFVRIARRFLLVIMFLLLTMSAGLFVIRRSKKRDLKIALELQSSKEKTANIRQKAVEIAYTNIVTGLKNRYYLSEHLQERMQTENLAIVLYNYNNFKSINEIYGREAADDFMATAAQKLVREFSDIAEIFSTEIDEICVVFHNGLPNSRVKSAAYRILSVLSQPIQIRDTTIQLTVAGCICRCAPKTYASPSSLFIALDHGVSQTKIACAEQNNSLLLPLQ